ncbi:MAG TPA: transporter [Vicinamibacteria bacterium]
MGSRTAAFLLLVLAAARGDSQTVPLTTETAATGPARRTVFETAAEAIDNEPSYVTGAERLRWDGPLLRLVYSPASNVELDIDWVVRVGAGTEPGQGSVSDYGDVTLRAKWRFLEGRPGRPHLAARFGVTLPQTSYSDTSGRALGLGPNTLRAFAQGLATFPLGSRGRLHANLGFLIFDEVFRPHDQRDFMLYGLAGERDLGAGVELLAEVAGRTGDGEPGAEVSAEARAGLRFGKGRVRGVAAVRRGLATADGTWGGSLGLTWTLRGGGGAAPVAP